MRRFQQEFNIRKSEIEIYFNFTSDLDNIETYKKSNIKLPDNSSMRFSRDLQKVLRSNCYVMLYNLIESTIRNGILEIYDEIHDSELSVNDVSNKIKELWLKRKSLALGKISSTQKFKKSIEILIDEISAGASILFNGPSLNISGNLDYKSITEISNQYGFHGKITTTNKSLLKTALLNIKQKRNYLAHGNESFTKASELTPMTDLNLYKDEIIQYLSDIVNSICEYLKHEKYKKTTHNSK